MILSRFLASRAASRLGRVAAANRAKRQADNRALVHAVARQMCVEMNRDVPKALQ